MAKTLKDKGAGPPGGNDYLSILSIQQEGVVVLDQEQIVRYINPAAARMIQSTLSESTGSVFPYEVDNDATTEFEVQAADGKTLWVQATCTETTWEGQKAYIALLKDVSRRKREEELLRKAVSAAEARASELEALKFVADQLNQAALLEDAIQSGLETVMALIDSEAVWVLLPEETGNTRMIASYSRENFLKSEKRTLGPGFHCEGLDRIMDGELLGPRLQKDAACMREAALSPSLPDEHYYVPLHIEGKAIGSLNLVLADRQELSAQDNKLLKTISQQLAAAIQRSMPVSALEASAKYGKALNQVSRTISSSLDLPAILQNILKLAVDLVGAQAGCLGTLSSNKLSLSFETKIPETSETQHLMKADNILWQVVETGQSVLLEDVGSVQRELPGNFCTGAKNMIIVPVVAGKQTLGALALYSTSPENALNAFDQAIAESLGQQAGIAVHNAQLFYEVQQLTTTDPLTGLNNQNSFINQAVRELERTWRYKRPLSILSVVIDDIRAINDRFGREYGDRVLQALGRISTESLRRVDVSGRYSGNNFIILLPETNSENALEVAERLRNKAEAFKLEAQEGTVTFTISIGIAELVKNEVIDLERFIERAKEALYMAILRGGNRTVLWELEKPIR